MCCGDLAKVRRYYKSSRIRPGTSTLVTRVNHRLPAGRCPLFVRVGKSLTAGNGPARCPVLLRRLTSSVGVNLYSCRRARVYPPPRFRAPAPPAPPTMRDKLLARPLAGPPRARGEGAWGAFAAFLQLLEAVRVLYNAIGAMCANAARRSLKKTSYRCPTLPARQVLNHRSRVKHVVVFYDVRVVFDDVQVAFDAARGIFDDCQIFIPHPTFPGRAAPPQQPPRLEPNEKARTGCFARYFPGKRRTNCDITKHHT